MAKTATTTVRLDPLLLTKLKLCADRKRISMNKMSQQFIEEGVERMEGLFDPAITRAEGLKILNTVRDIGAEKTLITAPVLQQILNSLLAIQYILVSDIKKKGDDKFIKNTVYYAEKKTKELLGNIFGENG